MNFCRRCGSSLTNVENHIFKCENEHIIFANCSPSTGVFIINPDGKLLLSVRGIEPHKGMLDAFGGFLDGEETAEDALARELTEELGITTNDYSAPTYLTTAVGHYPYKNETLPVLTLLYYVTLKPGVILQPQDDVADIVEVDLFDVDYTLLHDDDIVVGVKALQKQLS